MPHRLPQINELILHELNTLLLTQVDFPRDCLVTITFVHVSKDLRQAKVGISVLPLDSAKAVLKIIRQHVGRLQLLLNRKLSLKPLPRLSFVIDDTEARAAEVEEAINRISS